MSLIVLARYLLDCPDRTAELAQLVAAGLPATVVYGENDDAWPPAGPGPDGPGQLRRRSARASPAPRTLRRSRRRSPQPSTLRLSSWNAAERRQPTVHSCGRGQHRGGRCSPIPTTSPGLSRAWAVSRRQQSPARPAAGGAGRASARGVPGFGHAAAAASSPAARAARATSQGRRRQAMRRCCPPGGGEAVHQPQPGPGLAPNTSSAGQTRPPLLRPCNAHPHLRDLGGDLLGPAELPGQ